MASEFVSLAKTMFGKRNAVPRTSAGLRPARRCRGGHHVLWTFAVGLGVVAGTWSLECSAAPAQPASSAQPASGPGEQEPDADALARARELFAAGKEKMDLGQWSQAAEHFRQAASVKDTPGLRYHVAFCEENAGHFVEAFTQYEAAQALLRVRPAPDVADLLGPALERVDRKIPRLSLTFEPAVQPSRVSIDGRTLEAWDDVRLDPGAHELRVEAAGFQPYAADIRLEPGERQVVAVVLVEPAEATAPVVSHDRRSSWRTPAIVTGAAISAAGFGLGVWGLLDRAAANREVGHAGSGIERLSDSQSACAGATGDLVAPCADLERALERRERGTMFAVGGFVALGVGASVTVASLFFWPEQSVEVSAMTRGDFSGLRVGGRF